MDETILQDALRDQIKRAIENGYKRFDMHDLEKHIFSCELIGKHINVILVEKSGRAYETDVCVLSDLYFSHGCEFLRFVLGEALYLEVAREILQDDDTQRLLIVSQVMQGLKASQIDREQLTLTLHLNDWNQIDEN